MASSEKHHYIAKEDLKEKYRGYHDRIKSYSKAIADSTRTKIRVEPKKNKTIQFVIVGGKGVEKALLNIKQEFEASKVSATRQTFLDNAGQKTLLNEGCATLLTEDALRKHDILTGAIQLRQFGCQPCDIPWWKNVLRTKPISSCPKCNIRYDALERDQEFGIGRYLCLECDHQFYARCEATEKKICNKCQKMVGPPFINPRFKRRRQKLFEPPLIQGHYAELLVKVINPSKVHESTGSTCTSFLTQDLGSDISSVQVFRFQKHSSRLKFESDSDGSGDCGSGGDGDISGDHGYSGGSEGGNGGGDSGDDSGGSEGSGDNDDQDSTAGEIGDLESSDDELESKRRVEASDSENEEDKVSAVQASHSDLGISTYHTGTGSSDI